MPAVKSVRREFMQAAETYRPGKDKVGGWLLSEKLDGTRCFWDGGITRGMRTEDVPWAGIFEPKKAKADKVTKRLDLSTLVRKGKIKPVSTGMWSRYGNPIMVPDEFLNQLPCVGLDGELWAGRGNFQLCRSICAGDSPDPRFMDEIKYAVYSMPPATGIYHTGDIKLTQMARSIDYAEVQAFLLKRMKSLGHQLFSLPEVALFEDEITALGEYLDPLNDRLFMHRQIKLPADHDEAAAMVEVELNKVLELGGEGVVIRNPAAPWTPKRHRGVLKYKPYTDDEAVITGYTSGAETDLGSKHLGKIGALITEYRGKRLKVSGLQDVEREFKTAEMSAFARANPDKDMPKDFRAKSFAVGQTITFKFRELSDDGIPKEASYMREKSDE
jgi:DNA ligase-1